MLHRAAAAAPLAAAAAAPDAAPDAADIVLVVDVDDVGKLPYYLTHQVACTMLVK